MHVDDLLREYDDFVASNSQASIIGSKGQAWASTLLKELRKSKIRRSDIVHNLGPSLVSFENYVDGRFFIVILFCSYQYVSSIS